MDRGHLARKRSEIMTIRDEHSPVETHFIASPFVASNSPLRTAFTLIEILVVLGILVLLAAILLPTLSRVRENGRAASCTSNLRQIGMGLMQYTDDYNGYHPIAGATVAWDAIDPGTGNGPWMRQMQAYLKDQQVFHCPSDGNSKYSYSLSARVAYLDAGEFASTNTKQIQFPTAFVVAGDTWSRTPETQHTDPDYATKFDAEDADKDDYSQNCVGGIDNGTPAMQWERHNGGQNIAFADGHVKRFQVFNKDLMTFRYDSMHGWQ